MRLNDDGKTVAAMDVLVPGVGELIGGSQREERLDVRSHTYCITLVFEPQGIGSNIHVSIMTWRFVLTICATSNEVAASTSVGYKEYCMMQHTVHYTILWLSEHSGDLLDWRIVCMYGLMLVINKTSESVMGQNHSRPLPILLLMSHCVMPCTGAAEKATRVRHALGAICSVFGHS